MAAEYDFYMSRYVDTTDTWETKNLESDFVGLKYIKCEGLSDKGKIKNSYTESYMDSEELRLYVPDTPLRESTDIEFEFGFSGDNRWKVYDEFVEWIGARKVKYWDTCRNRELEMVLSDKIEISDELLYGSTPYFVAQFKFTNLRGYTTEHEDNTLKND